MSPIHEFCLHPIDKTHSHGHTCLPPREAGESNFRWVLMCAGKAELVLDQLNKAELMGNS